MYEAFFGMTHTPFTRDLPPECLYETKAMSDVLGRLMYVADKKLFAVITSEPGCGKSTLLRKFDAMLPKDEYILLYLSDSKLTPKWFYKGLLEQLGIDSGFYRGDAKRQLQASIEIIQGVQKKRVVCILDEAHLLDKEMLEEFRFMLNYKFDSESPMALVLAGQTELWDRKLKLQRYGSGSISTVRCHLSTGRNARTTSMRTCSTRAARRTYLPTRPSIGSTRSRTVFHGW